MDEFDTVILAFRGGENRVPHVNKNIWTERYELSADCSEMSTVATESSADHSDVPAGGSESFAHHSEVFTGASESPAEVSAL
jgi:hypothetical protein